MKQLFNFFILFLILSLVSCSSQKTSAEKPSGIKIAVSNYFIEGGKTYQDLLKKIQMNAQVASEAGAAYLLLPELIELDTFAKNPGEEEVMKSLDDLATQSKQYVEDISHIAQKHHISILGASFVTRDSKSFYNRALYVDENGMAHFQDKIHPTPWETKHGFNGGKELQLFKTKDFSFVILICHDAEFPSLSQKLSKLKPEVIFVPSQTDDLQGMNRVKFASSARAIEHMSYVIMTGTSGDPHAPWHTYAGQNYFFKPQNKYFPLNFEKSSSARVEKMSFYHLDLPQLRKSRGDLNQVYPARDETSSSDKLKK